MRERTQEEILLAWKEEYWDVYTITINEIVFVFRGLSPYEYKMITTTVEDDSLKEDLICQACILEPVIEDWAESIYGGYTQALCASILQNSGFIGDGGLETRKRNYENEMNTFDNQMPCIIHEAFPEYELMEIEQWSLDKSLFYYSRAMWILENLKGIRLEPVGEEG